MPCLPVFMGLGRGLGLDLGKGVNNVPDLFRRMRRTYATAHQEPAIGRGWRHHQVNVYATVEQALPIRECLFAALQ